jgi:hypothetical protein
VPGQVFQQHRPFTGIAQRDAPVRVLGGGPWHVLRAALADRVGERYPDQGGRGPGEVGVERDGERRGLRRGTGRDEALPGQRVAPGEDGRGGVSAFCRWF